jgi:hypothetical protein
MSTLSEIEKVLEKLPQEKQNQVLDYILFLQQRMAASPSKKAESLAKHHVFGSWKKRKINALDYQRDLRAEWQA